jgi:hypothetical protein
MRNSSKVLEESFKGKNFFGDLDLDGIIILKVISEN